MISTMTITETRKKITSLENTMNYDDTISITNHGKEVFALIRWDTGIVNSSAVPKYPKCI